MNQEDKEPTVDEWMEMINEHNRDLNSIPEGVKFTRFFEPDFKGWHKEKPEE